MAAQTFNPTDLSQSATNWAVAQRIVGPFAPHAQVTPNLTLALDPGFLLSGTTLTEVNAQNVGPFAPPSSGLRIDRVVIDRSTGAASIVTGAANSLTPPTIPTGKLPVARVMLQATTDAITNTVIVDERALSDLTPQTTNPVITRATLGGADQSGFPSATIVKVNLSTVDYNVGGGFDTTNRRFKPNLAGYYQIYAQNAAQVNSGGSVSAMIYKNGSLIANGTNNQPVASGVITAPTSSIVYLNGSSDFIELYGVLGGGTVMFGDVRYTFMTASFIG